MKRQFFIGFVPLCLVAIGVFFVIRNNIRQEENSMDAMIATRQEVTDMDVFIDSFPKEEQGTIREEYESQMRRAKASGDDKWIAHFEKSLQESFQSSLNSPELPDDDYENVQYYEDKIRKAIEKGASEERIAMLERLRGYYQQNIVRDKEIDRKFAEDRARFEALRTPQERIAYYEQKLPAAEEALRLAQENGNASAIRWAQWDVESINLDIKTLNRELAWLPIKEELDARRKHWEEVKRPKLIEQYRDLWHIEEVDGVERIVGVRTPAEITAVAKTLISNRSSVEPSKQIFLPDASDVGASPQGKPLSPEVEVETPFVSSSAVPIESMTTAQKQFLSWRKDLDNNYLDVLVSQQLTPQEINQYFPTELERQNLKSRTSEMQEVVVSKVRSVVSQIQGATADQRLELAHQLVMTNFDKDFADAVIERLQLDNKR